MNPTVGALNKLSIFGPDQGGAYREHSAAVRRVLGPDVDTIAGAFVSQWAAVGTPGVLILTGNAGTGKTALAENYCDALTVQLPDTDRLVEAAPGRWVVKDLSGVPVRDRPSIVEYASAVSQSSSDQLLICANEGVLRGLIGQGLGEVLARAVDQALVGTAGVDGTVTVLNMNRQRWTSVERWHQVLDYFTRDDLWDACDGCPAKSSCPITSNAIALRRTDVREAARGAFRLASAETVAPLREILTVLAQTITGGLTCEEVSHQIEEAGRGAYTAEHGYFNLVFGGGLDTRTSARSPLIRALAQTGVGTAADLQMDAWLRESGEDNAPEEIRVAGGANGQGPLVQVRVGTEARTFADVGQTLTIDADAGKVAEYSRHLLGEGGHLSLWRRKLFFEAPKAAAQGGGPFARLTLFRSYGRMLEIIETLRDGETPADATNLLIRGLNFLSCGTPRVGSELHIPDPGLLSARNPGSLLPARPMVVFGSVAGDELSLALEGTDSSRQMLDHDDVRLRLAVRSPTESLLLTPTLFEILMNAGEYRAAPGLDAPEVADLRLFYARLATGIPQAAQTRIARSDQDGLTIFKPPVLKVRSS